MKGFQASVVSMAIIISVAVISVRPTLGAAHVPLITVPRAGTDSVFCYTSSLDKSQFAIENEPHSDKLLVWTRYSWVNNDWEPYSREIYDYSGESVLRRTIEQWSDSLFESNLRWTYYYFSDGKLGQTLNERWDGLEWRYNTLWTNTYDDSGRVIEFLIDKWGVAGNYWTNSSRSWSFYVDNLLVAETTYTSDGWSWFYSDNTQYTYDNSGNMTQCTHQYQWPLPDGWLNFWQQNNTYSSSGRLSESILLYWTDGAWLNGDRSTYESDEFGRDTVVADYTWNEDTWKLNDIDTTRFDDENRIVEQISFRTADSYLKKENYFYNELGNLVERVAVSSHDGDPLRNSGRMTYEYETATAVEATDSRLPVGFALRQNYPNPFNPTTAIEYETAISSEITITISNILGQAVKTLRLGQVSAGIHSTSWDGTDSDGRPVASGVYFYRLSVGSNHIQRKMLLLR